MLISEKKSKSCHHYVLAYNKDRKEASGLEHEASTSSHDLCQMEHFYIISTDKTPRRAQHPTNEVMRRKGKRKGKNPQKTNKPKPKNNLATSFITMILLWFQE